MTSKVYSEVDTGEAPLEGVSEDELHALVDEVLRTGKNRTIPMRPDGAPELSPDRFHARVIAAEMRRLATTLAGPLEVAEDVDEWWFEVEEKRHGPISLHKARYLWEEGVLTPDSLCWHEGFANWVFIHKVSELAEALAPRAGAMPKPQPPPIVKVPPPRSETSSDSWKPMAGATLQTQKRLKLAAAQAASTSSASIASPDVVATPEPEPQPELDVGPHRTPAPVEWSPSTSGHAGTFASIPSIAPAAPVEKPRRFAHSLVTGLAAGVVIAGALVAVRIFMPETPQQPVVVVVHDPADAAAATNSKTAPQQQAAHASGVTSPQGTKSIAAPAASPHAPSAASSPQPADHRAPGAGEPPATTPAAAKSSKSATGSSSATTPGSAGAASTSVATRAESKSQPAASASDKPKPQTVDSAFAEQFTAPPDELEKSEILEVVAAHKAEVDACGKQLAPHEDSLRLVMRWKVSLDGQVSDVSARTPELADSPAAKCLANAIGGWTFPKHEVPHEPIELPFVF